MCHAETPAAVKAFVEAARYPFHAAAKGLGVGRRGSGGQEPAAAIWGLSVAEYLDRADVWPLNPDGELMLGLKIENRRALENAEASAAVPGLAFAEWGPGDMGMSFGHKDAHDPPYPPEMTAARARVKAACDRAGLAFLDLVRPDNVTAQLDDGVGSAPPPRKPPKSAAATPSAPCRGDLRGAAIVSGSWASASETSFRYAFAHRDDSRSPR